MYGGRLYREKDHDAFEAGLGRQKGHHGEMVAVTVFDDLIDSPNYDDVAWSRDVCPFLSHEPSLELCLDHGLFLGLQGLLWLSTDLSTADSFGTQPCNLL